MILEALYRLALREELIGDPDYELRPVAWLVQVDDGGRLLGIEPTHSQPDAGDGRKKPKPVAKSFAVPRQPIRTSGDRAFFLCDKAEYALGLDPAQEGDTRRSPEKVAARFALFREQVAACAAATGDAGVLAVHRLLERIASGEQPVACPPECAPGDLFAFVYAPDVERRVHDRPAVRAYWKEQRGASSGAGDGNLRCLVTGAPMTQAGLFPMLKRVPGGNASGAALVSFNSAAFESYGWRGNENAPISREAAEAAATALNRLLHPAFPDPRPERLGDPLPRRHVRLGADAVVCYWASDAGAEAFLDVLGGLLEADPEIVGEAYRSIWSGRPVHVENPSAFYAVTLSGAQGRVMIRDWFESNVADVVRSMARHFADLNVVRNTPPPRGREVTPQLPLRVLLASLAPLGRSESVPSALAADFVRAGLRGEPHYPVAILAKALERTRAEAGRTDWSAMERRDARASLIRAVLRRNFSHKELTPAMDPVNTQPGYLLGRLMAVLERLQQVALGLDVSATVVDRFFGAASATPQAVFPRLLKNARNHARKGENDAQKARTAAWLDRQIDDILSRLQVQRQVSGPFFAGFPPHLPLEQQGLFVLGYHQQRHWLRLSREERERLQAEAAAEPAAVPA